MLSPEFGVRRKSRGNLSVSICVRTATFSRFGSGAVSLFAPHFTPLLPLTHSHLLHSLCVLCGGNGGNPIIWMVCAWPHCPLAYALCKCADGRIESNVHQSGHRHDAQRWWSCASIVYMWRTNRNAVHLTMQCTKQKEQKPFGKKYIKQIIIASNRNNTEIILLRLK